MARLPSRAVVGRSLVLGGLWWGITILLAAVPAHAAEWVVAPGGTGIGTAASPLGRIQDALDRAQPGDLVLVRAGTYAESIRTIRPGAPASPIRLQGTGGSRAVIVTMPGRVATLSHAFITIENVVFDGQYGADDTVRVGSGAQGLMLRNLEVRRSSRDLIDMGAPRDVTIDGCLIHRALNAAGGRTDAHGIAAGAVQNLTIRNTEIHTFSGDGLQVDPGRSAPGWDNVVVERVRIWLGPLAAPENGFRAGTVPGENGIDTKAGASFARAHLTVRDTIAWGFRNGLISNMAAFNVKENVDVTFDGVTVHDSEIAFRLRGGGKTAGGAWASVQNAVVYRVSTAFRYEDDIEKLRISNSTIGAGVDRIFRAAASSSSHVQVMNLLALGALPPEASHPSNMSVTAAAFVNVGGDDYHLAPGSKAVNGGVTLEHVDRDRDGTPRPKDARYDIGAYER